MKKIVSALLAVVLLLTVTGAIADQNITAVGVGSCTKELSYEVVETGLNIWGTKADGMSRFAFVAIKNTDNRPIYMKSCSFDFEDDNGHLLENESRVSNCPSVIDPGEIGYFYVSSVNGGGFDGSVDFSNGCNMVAQFTLQVAKETVEPFEVTDTTLTSYDMFSKKYPMITGRIKNTSEKDVSMLYVNYVLKDHEGKVIWISGTNIMDLYAGVRVGFELKILYPAPNVTEENIGSYDIIAEPSYYQF